MSDRGFTHPNFGRQVRIEQFGKEVHLIFVAATMEHLTVCATLFLSRPRAVRPISR